MRQVFGRYYERWAGETGPSLACSLSQAWVIGTLAMAEEPVFDSAHLDRQTMGDEALRVEILALFVAEIERLLAQLESAPDPLVRASRLHAMMGLARNVGALRLAALCRQLQHKVAAGSAEDSELAGLRAAVQEAIEQVHAGAV